MQTKGGGKVVATCGTFDLLHSGHKELLTKACELGQYLAVIVVPDRIVYENKRRHPVYDQEERAERLRELLYVDEVHIDCIEDGLESLIRLKPDVFIFGYDQKTQNCKRLIEHLDRHGIRPEYVTIETDLKVHTSQLIMEKEGRRC